MSTEPAGDNDDPMGEWAAAAGTQLDQNSIDSLFDEPAVATASNEPRRGLDVLIGSAIVGYDRMPMLDIVVDRFGRLMTSSVRKFTADTADITVSKTRPTRLGDFLNKLTLPSLIAVIRAEQWDGYMLAALNAQLIGSVMDVLLGGRRNQAQPIEGRPLSQIERALLERMMADAVIGELKRAFSAVCEVDLVIERYEITPSYAAITKPSAAAVSFRTELAMDGDRGGYIDFLIPYAVLEPVRDILSQDFIGKKQSGDTMWQSHLWEEVPQATVELRAELERRTISVSEVARWQPGSVLLLDRRGDDPVNLFCEEMLVAHAHIGEQAGRMALQVDDICIAMPERPAPPLALEA